MEKLAVEKLLRRERMSRTSDNVAGKPRFERFRGISSLYGFTEFFH